MLLSFWKLSSMHLSMMWETFLLLNNYLAMALPEITAKNGYIDKFIGDAGMFHWNTIIPQNDHHNLALQAAQEIEKNIDSFLYSGIEWRPQTYLNVSKEESDAIIKVLENLEEDDDVQNTFVNCNIHTS